MAATELLDRVADGREGLGIEGAKALVDEQAVEPDGAGGALDLLAELERERERGQEGLAAGQGCRRAGARARCRGR